MKIAFVTAGAAGMYCGSCLRDNALARALMDRGHEVLLIPTYTPTRTDEPNVSISRVFLGGINVYLQYKSALFRYTPRFADRLFDSPRLLNWASSFAVKTDASDLGALTFAMLEGEDGPNRKEFAKLVDWLGNEVRPDIVDLSNSLLIGLASPLRRQLGVPVVCTLSGEDLFLEGIPEPWHTGCLNLLRRRVADVDAFVTFNQYYAGFMSEYLQIPADKLYQVPLGVTLEDLPSCDSALTDGSSVTTTPTDGRVGRRPLTIGYLARICHEKGAHVLCEAFRILRSRGQFADCRLRLAGYLGERDQEYWKCIEQQIGAANLGDAVEYVGEVDRAGKDRFLRSVDVFSVPTIYRESKGIPILEAWAHGVPVVQPWHGVFTELVNATQGGVLVPPNDPQGLADGIAQLLENEPLRLEMGRRGRVAVEKHFTARCMADATVAVYQSLIAKSCPTA